MSNERTVKVIEKNTSGENNGVLNVAAYCRVSTGSEEQADSFITQIKYYTDFINRSENMRLVSIYADEGITGTCADKRPEFQRMLKDSRAGKIDRLYVKSVSRFARNSLECIEYVRMLHDNGTSVYFENDGIDSSSMNSEMILYLKSAFAQCEALAGSKRVSTSIRMKMKNGHYITCNAPYGYRLEDGMLYPIEEEAEIVRYIFKLYLDGNGFCTIANILNKDEATDKAWNSEAVKYILTNEKYIGDSLLQKTYTPALLPLRNIPNNGELDKFYVNGSHAPIVDEDTFYKVRTLLENKRIKYDNSSKVQKGQYIFSGKIRCGDCGGLYKRKNQNGKISWICAKKGMPGNNCQTHTVQEEVLKSIFITLYNKLRQNEKELVDFCISSLNSMRAAIYRSNSDISEIDFEVAKICEKINMLTNLHTKGIIDEISFSEQINSLKDRSAVLKNRRSRIASDDMVKITISDFYELKNLLNGMPLVLLDFDKDIFCELIECIKITKDNEYVFEMKCGLEFVEDKKWN